MFTIYKITNLINGKVYIGKTSNFKRRMSQHFDEEHSTESLIKNSIRKNGKENFKIDIIEETLNRQEAKKLEEDYIKLYKSYKREFGYNIKIGEKHTPETKLHIGLAQIGEKNHMYNKRGKLNKTSKPIVELKTNKKYESIMEAARDLNLNFSHIAAVCRGTRNSTGGYMFRFLDKNGNIIETDRPEINRARRIRNKTTGKIYESFKEIEQDLGHKIDSGCIIKNIKGKTKTSYKYEWEYLDPIPCHANH